MPQKCVFRGPEDITDIFGPPAHQESEIDDSDSDSDGGTVSASSSQAGSDSPSEASNSGSERSVSAHQVPEGGQPARDEAEASTTTLDGSQQSIDPAGAQADVDSTEPEDEAASGNIDVSANVDKAASSSSGFAAGGAADDQEHLETVAGNAIAALNNTTTPNLPQSSASNEKR